MIEIPTNLGHEKKFNDTSIFVREHSIKERHKRISIEKSFFPTYLQLWGRTLHAIIPPPSSIMRNPVYCLCKVLIFTFECLQGYQDQEESKSRDSQDSQSDKEENDEEAPRIATISSKTTGQDIATDKLVDTS